MKIHRIKNYLKLGSLLFGVLTATLACQEESIDSAEEPVVESRIKRVSLNEFSSLMGANKDYKKLSALFDVNKFNNLNSQQRLDASDDPYLITDEIVMITRGDFVVYTFKIGKNTISDEFYNLLVSVDASNDIRSATILEYVPSERWLEDRSLPFSGNVKIHENDIFSITDINTTFSARGSGGCVSGVSGGWECDAGNNHSPSDYASNGGPCHAGGAEYTITVHWSACNEISVGGSAVMGGDFPIDGEDGSSSGGGSGGSGDPGGGNDNEEDNSQEDYENCILDSNGDCLVDETTPFPPKPPKETPEEKPCPGDPVPNPEIAPQLGPSGTKGALHGCTRYGGTCTNPDGRTKSHNGIDLKSDYGDPIYAMYSGFIYSSKYDPDGAGYNTRIQSTVNGETILISYFHLQEDNRVLQSSSPLNYVNAGDVIGYQGDSGNLRGAIEDGGVDSHIHIEVRVHNSSNQWGYNNFDLADPKDYLNKVIDDEGNSEDTTDCN